MKQQNMKLLPRISNYIHYEMLSEITYPFPNFNGEILGLNSIQHGLTACVRLFLQH